MTKSTKHTPGPREHARAARELAALRRLLTDPDALDVPTPTHRRIREGPRSIREPVAGMELVNVGYRVGHKRRLDVLRTDLSEDGRVLPLWEVVGRLVALGERVLRGATSRGRRGARRRGSR